MLGKVSHVQQCFECSETVGPPGFLDYVTAFLLSLFSLLCLLSTVCRVSFLLFPFSCVGDKNSCMSSTLSIAILPFWMEFFFFFALRYPGKFLEAECCWTAYSMFNYRHTEWSFLLSICGNPKVGVIALLKRPWIFRLSVIR